MGSHALGDIKRESENYQGVGELQKSRHHGVDPPDTSSSARSNDVLETYIG